MPTLHSHTHCQAAQANATTQAWQRVFLSNRTTKTTDNLADEKEHRSDNSVYVAIAGEVVNRRSVLLSNIVLNGQESASNPLLHIHAKRCRQAKRTEQMKIIDRNVFLFFCQRSNGTFGFSNAQVKRKKPKEPFFLPTH